MMQTGSRYGMITMQDAIADLFEAGIIGKDARRATLLTTNDDGDGDEQYAAAALGGAKLNENAPVPGGAKNEGYSF